jgi:hypothetical protein
MLSTATTTVLIATTTDVQRVSGGTCQQAAHQVLLHVGA